MMIPLWGRYFLTMIICLSLAVWAWGEAGSFLRQVMPRLVKITAWPDMDAVQAKARLERVNIHTPDFGRLARALAGQGSLDEQKVGLAEGARYYQYISEWMPGMFEAYLVRGVCEYGLGNHAEAEKSLKKAAVLKPDFFWVHYNLGMLYFNAGAYPLAQDFLDRAVILAGKHDERMLLRSKIFIDLLRAGGANDPGAGFVSALKDLQKARARSSLFLAMFFKQQGDEESFRVYYEKAMGQGLDPREIPAGNKFSLRAY